MSSPVDICNIALSRLGDRATVTSISPSDGSAQADHCARFYPIALKTLLASHRWSFAISRAALAYLGEVPVGEGHMLAVPADCVSIIEVIDTQNPGADSHYRYEMYKGSRILVCESSDIWIRYLSSSVDSSIFPATFVDALAWLLASYLSGSMTPGSTGSQMATECLKYYETFRQKAVHEDAQQNFEHVTYRPAFIGDYTGDRHGEH